MMRKIQKHGVQYLHAYMCEKKKGVTFPAPVEL